VRLAQTVHAEAQRLGVRAAVCGGLAVQLYGFTRATNDIDFVADQFLLWPEVRRLTFGGAQYKLQLSDGTAVPLDWIVRSDGYEELYRAALADAVPTDAGFWIVTAEWLVILKMFAQRGKDYLDALWLLRADGLIDRNLVVELLHKHLLRTAAYFVPEMRKLFLEADLLRARDEHTGEE
jgi:hypothetical protein